MRLNIALGIIVALSMPLQGCGKKGPLTFPAPQVRTPDSKPQQAPAAPAAEPNKQP